MQKEIEELESSICEAEQELKELNSQQQTPERYSWEDYCLRKKGLKQEIQEMRESLNVMRSNQCALRVLH